ncbi:hypothetical protein N7489_006136 [Penicillium chrysogenum]|jgi:hypothetical protein|uniref:Uncharacterized protein n=1 Tax=Penicillium chrysogenum TaxID=5076 RepID=A0ABQ8W2P3_PENCH|nr:uncharacterized protein N7489_006136 [Penicillium chrysogenum]KAJ5236045.1 hypothetical protein N7489_006136 [Penicillium chrysogenum]KAJ5254950.1 hypothetical protein N7505_010101 [Penicillium chrysogenum]KAJ5275984.1 hypothetical protein N7524_002137 [Penicillium chrysogenum]KAJ6153257.1 hypothetical protein N7497_007576 [Penicillium chrysogenum]
MSGSHRGHFEAWELAGAVKVVPMGQAQFLDFREKDAIGTKGLGSCSVVVIASAHGAILAHIPPQPQATSNPTSGDANVQLMMNQVGILYRDKRQFFSSAETIVICAVFQGQVALPSQLDIMQMSLIGLGLTTKIISYEVPGDSSIVGKGTVIVIKKREYAKPKILVEDHYATI